MAAGIHGGQVTVMDVIPEHLGACLQAGGGRHACGVRRESHYGLRHGLTESNADSHRHVSRLRHRFTAADDRASAASQGEEHRYRSHLSETVRSCAAAASTRRRDRATERKRIYPRRTSASRRLGACYRCACRNLPAAGRISGRGHTCITGVEHIERGYEDVIASFRSIGAKLSVRELDEQDLPGRIMKG